MNDFLRSIGWVSAGAFVVSVGAIVVLRGVAIRFDWLDRPGRHKMHDAPVPLLGGIAVALALVLVAIGARVVFSWGDLRLPAAWWCALGAATFVGLLDDLAPGGSSPREKLAGQAVAAVLGAAAGASVGPGPSSFMGLELLGYPWWLILASVGAGVLLMNAFNLVDNSNGSCVGLGIVAASGILVTSVLGASIAIFANESSTLVPRDFEAAIVWKGTAYGSALLIGALLGVLPFNYPRARIFLGDAGSHLVGIALASLMLMIANRMGTTLHSALYFGVLFAVPLADVAWVIAVRLRERRPIMVGDREHLAHRLGRRFDSPARAVAVLWLAGACSAGLAVLVMWGSGAAVRPLSVAATLAIVAALYTLAADDRGPDERRRNEARRDEGRRDEGRPDEETRTPAP